MAKYASFNFEALLNPKGRSGDEVIEEMKRLHNPNEFFEARYDEDIAEIEAVLEEEREAEKVEE